MKKTECVRLVAVAVSCFPSLMERNMEPTTEAWHQMLGDLDYRLAEAALQKVLATAKFFPTVAEIREAASSLMQTTDSVPDAESAWGEVWEAVTKHGYLRAPISLKSSDPTEVIMVFGEPWDFSHPVIGEAARRMWGSWVDACRECQTETAGVQRSQFLKLYATVSKRQREDALMPPAVKRLAAELREKMAAKLASANTPQLQAPRNGESP